MEHPSTPSAVRRLVVSGCLPADPVPWLLESTEPYAVWATLRNVLGLSASDPAVEQAHGDVCADENVQWLIGELPAGLTPTTSDHHSPLFLPNRLDLLADMGIRLGDSPRVDALLEALAGTQDRFGRFTPRQTARGSDTHVSPRCEHNAVAEVLLRYDLTDDRRVARGVGRVVADLQPGTQGRGWCCAPSKRSLRSPLRRSDVCPQIDLEGLRVVAMLPLAQRPKTAVEAARTPLEMWRRRSTEHPYRFGHGYQFKTVQWPSFWYDALDVVATIGRFPELWNRPDSRDEDRRAIAELAACLIAYNTDASGLVTPRRIHRGYERFSFGDKCEPSPFATAQVLSALVRVADLAEQIAAVDVASLASSKGGSDTAVPPSKTPAERAVCRTPALPVFEGQRVLARVLTRHHLSSQWEPHSPESVVSDIVCLTITSPATPYHSLAARMIAFDAHAVQTALDKRHSLARWRGMRGLLVALRRDFVPVVHAATSRQVIRHARDFAQSKGISSAAYDRWAPAIVEACSQTPMSRRRLREALSPDVDLGALLTLMTAEGVVVRVAPQAGHDDRTMLYAPFASIYAGLDLARYSEEEARAQLLRAYVRGYGPVTRQDAAWWTGMDLKRVDRAVRMLEDELLEISLKGGEQTWLMHAADADELERAAFLEQPSVVALPANDPLMLGYADRSRFLDDIARPFVYDSANNAAPVVLVNGRVVAVWDVTRAEADGSSVLAALFPVAPIDAEATEAVPAALARVLRCPESTAPRVVAGMRTLLERPVGAFMHPLR